MYILWYLMSPTPSPALLLLMSWGSVEPPICIQLIVQMLVVASAVWKWLLRWNQTCAGPQFLFQRSWLSFFHGIKGKNALTRKALLIITNSQSEVSKHDYRYRTVITMPHTHTQWFILYVKAREVDLGHADL